MSGAGPENRTVVRCDDERIECHAPNSVPEVVRWADLDAVVLESSATGPFSAEVFWILVGTRGESGCVIPPGAAGERALRERLQALPGFDLAAFRAAMASASQARFLCWRRRVE